MNAIPPAPPSAARSPEHRALIVGVAVLLALLLFRGYGSAFRVEPSQQTAAQLPLDLNTADRTELLQVPGVGPSLADAILTHRGTFGPFQTLDELDSVHGIGGKTLDKLRPWLTIDAKSNPKPHEPTIERLERAPTVPAPAVQPRKLEPGQKIDINSATVTDLQGLPGIGPKLAERIVAERARKRFDSPEDLRRVGGIGVKTIEKLRPFLAFAPSGS